MTPSLCSHLSAAPKWVATHAEGCAIGGMWAQNMVLPQTTPRFLGSGQALLDPTEARIPGCLQFGPYNEVPK